MNDANPSWTLQGLVVGPLANNVYILTCRATGNVLIIDAADEPARILGALTGTPHDGGAATKMPVVAIVTTHRHPDHWRGALAAVSEATHATTYAGADDAAHIGVATDEVLRNGDEVRVGELVLTAISLRGHTPGSVALALREPGGPMHLFTGDSLFPGGVGKTSSSAEFTSLIDDVTARIFDVYPDDTVVHPGHGAPTTLGEERPALGEWRVRGW